MGLFERYLTLWVALGITAGVGLGLAMPGLFQTVAALEVAHVNLVVAVFIWIMIYPMMVQIDWSAVRGVGRRPRGLALTLLVNWLIKPFTMAVAFAPIAAFLLGVTELTVPWTTLVLATVLYVVLLFGLQAPTLVTQPFVIALIAVPLVLQSYGVFALSWVGARWLKLPHDIAGPACLIGTSNFFELAVAVAISLFGLHSGAALATVVGVLVEVPVMLSLVWWVNRRGSALTPTP